MYLLLFQKDCLIEFLINQTPTIQGTLTDITPFNRNKSFCALLVLNSNHPGPEIFYDLLLCIQKTKLANMQQFCVAEHDFGGSLAKMRSAAAAVSVHWS